MNVILLILPFIAFVVGVLFGVHIGANSHAPRGATARMPGLEDETMDHFFWRIEGGAVHLLIGPEGDPGHSVIEGDFVVEGAIRRKAEKHLADCNALAAEVTRLTGELAATKAAADLHEAAATLYKAAVDAARAEGVAQGLRMAAEVAAEEGWPGSMSHDEYARLSDSDEAAMDCAERIAAAIKALIPAPAKGGGG